MKTTRRHSVPWDVPDNASFYSADMLAWIARQAARDQGGELLDWRIIVRVEGTTLQTRYLLSDGIARHHDTAL